MYLFEWYANIQSAVMIWLRLSRDIDMNNAYLPDFVQVPSKKQMLASKMIIS